MGSDIIFQKWACASRFKCGEFSFFGLGKTNFWGGAGVQLQNLLASDYPGAYTSMPHPSFGAKDVYYFVKKVAK